MAWSAVASALTTIGDLLTQEAMYLWGVKEQVDRLQRELKWMQSFLIDADGRQGESETVRLWVSEIRDLANDAEDVVETFALEIGSERKCGFSNCIKRLACILKEGRKRHKTRSEIEKIIARITDLTRQLQTYGIGELRVEEGSSSADQKRELRRSYPHIIEDYIVGLDDDIKKLVSIVVGDHCRVISICGMGGLGKTTLAKKVYHHTQIRGQFNHLAWVYVSQQCLRRKVLEDILSGLISPDERGSKLSDEELAEKLFKFLKDEKCLVILDDIWSTEAWDSIKAGFPMRETSSKILLTSRNKEVASHADRGGYLHELQCLNNEDSWELFRRTSFPERDSPDSRVDARMDELGKDMVKYCAGLPLAIVVLGGILATKNSFYEWQMVFENVKSQLKRGKGQGPEDVLALSYDDLSPYLKPCFLYLSLFPEDYEINAQRLVQLWVAEGFVSLKHEGDGSETTEDVAERYLLELAERCMIQIRQRDAATLKIKTFHMHDLMRDLCLSKAEQENFIFIVDQSNAYSSSKTRGARRISSSHSFSFSIQHVKGSNPRSLLFFNLYFAGQEIWSYMIHNFKLLRVLHLEGGGSVQRWKLPSDIGNLTYLRFLGIGDLYFFNLELPSSLGNLRCLQTLDLRVHEGSVRVPDVIWRMEQLRHLYLPQYFKYEIKLKLGTLRNLQTLVNFNTEHCYVEDLINMTNIRELEIYGPFYIEDFNEDFDNNPPIIKSKYLHSLSIAHRYEGTLDPRHLTHLLSSCVSACKLSFATKVSKLPEYHYFSSNIAYIHLDCCEVEEDPMPTLEKLPNLRILELGLHACNFTVKKMVCSAEGFPKLDSLSLNSLYRLEEWKVDEGAMPALRHLEIEECLSLKMLPDGLRFLTTFQELKIKSMP